MSDLMTDSEKLSLLKRLVRLRVPPDVLLALLVSVIEPVAAHMLMRLR